MGNAYREAARIDEAAGAFEQAIEMNPGMSRAYQLLGQMLMRLDQNDRAGEVLVKGYTTAAERGDVMPQKAIGGMLEKLGVELPEVEDAAERRAAVEASGNMVLDRRAGQPQPRLADPPMRGDLGRFIFAHFGQVTWNQWIGQGTKVINELRLDFSNVEDQDTYEQYMKQWLQVSDDEVAEWGRVNPAEATA
ncbi:MAG: Fe(2+)-trafficking protein [Planctomycetota bacterium]